MTRFAAGLSLPIAFALAFVRPDCAAQSSGQTTIGEPLSGVWEIRMAADSGTGTLTSVGYLSLARSRRSVPGGVWISMGAAEYAGLFAADFSCVGVRVPAESMAPVAAANYAAPAQVQLALNPGPDHGSLIFRGTLAGDSVEGRWSENAYAFGGEGRFQLRRLVNAQDWYRMSAFYQDAYDRRARVSVAGAGRCHSRDPR